MDITLVQNNLPSKLEDLAQFVLVGREKLTAVRAGIRAIDKLELASDVRNQKKEEAQMLAEALLDAEAKIGEITMKMPKASGARTDMQPSNSGVTRLETKQEAIENLGFSKIQVHRFETLAQNKDILEQVKAEAREADDLPTRTEVLRRVKIQNREEDIQAQREAIENSPHLNEQTKGLFDVIVLDPPWNYGREYDPETSRVSNPYPEMSQEELLELELPSKENSVLFLWTTHQFIFDAKELMDKWDFNYKATLVWNKEKIGMGHWFRMQCEFCLVGIKGKPFWNNTTWRDIITESRREHSRKPEAFYKMVDEITAGKKLEYFSRKSRDGWEVLGNDTEMF